MEYEDLTEFDTQLTADVVEWRPLDPQEDDSNILACGTYYLNKENNQRTGCLYLLESTNENKALELLSTNKFTDSGILDLKWISSTQLITIDSKNTINLFEYNKKSKALVESNLKQNLSSTEEENSIGLTIDFIHKKDSTCRILSSDTKGNLNLVEMGPASFSLANTFKAHDYEVWSVLIDRNDEQTIYSGADDCLLKMWDLRQTTDKPAGQCNVFEGGVCSILLPERSQNWLPNYTSNQILCGSYDERIYVLDKRNMKRSVAQSKKLDGGVWKMKLHPTRDLLLCACMHTGAHLVDTLNLKSLLYYDKHGLNNLVYGCDWKPKIDSSKSNTDVIATCSFYNHNLKIWKIVYN